MQLTFREFLQFKRVEEHAFTSAISCCSISGRGGSSIKQLQLNRAEFPTLSPHAR